jgi:hypothetical protein
MSRWATSTRETKGLDPNSVRTDFAVEVELCAPDVVKCLDLEGLAHGG